MELGCLGKGAGAIRRWKPSAKDEIRMVDKHGKFVMHSVWGPVLTYFIIFVSYAKFAQPRKRRRLNRYIFFAAQEDCANNCQIISINVE